MKQSIKTKWKKIDPRRLMLFDQVTITISGVLLFIVWLMFLTKNFYPKSNDNLAAIIMNWPLQASIWPVTLFLLFIFVLPIWVTNRLDLIVVYLMLSFLFLLLNIAFLAFVNVTLLWVLWLVIILLTTSNVVFALFSIIYLNKNNVKKKKSN